MNRNSRERKTSRNIYSALSDIVKHNSCERQFSCGWFHDKSIVCTRMELLVAAFMLFSLNNKPDKFYYVVTFDAIEFHPQSRATRQTNHISIDLSSNRMRFAIELRHLIDSIDVASETHQSSFAYSESEPSRRIDEMFQFAHVCLFRLRSRNISPTMRKYEIQVCSISAAMRKKKLFKTNARKSKQKFAQTNQNWEQSNNWNSRIRFKDFAVFLRLLNEAQISIAAQVWRFRLSLIQCQRPVILVRNSLTPHDHSKTAI